MQGASTSGENEPRSLPTSGPVALISAGMLVLLFAAGTVFAETRTKDEKITAVERIAPRIRQVTFKSRVLGAEKRFCVVLPGGYSAGGDLPWLALLHGRGRHERSLIDNPRARAALLKAPFTVVLPDGDDGWYIDSPAGRYQTYLAETLEVAMMKFGLSRKPSRRAITGWSMGGYGCTRFAQTQGGPKGKWRFALVAPIIGLLDYPSHPRSFPPGQSYPVRKKVFGKQPDKWDKLNPIRQAGKLRDMSVLLITADQAFDRTMNERFSRRLTELGIEHELKILDGTHSFEVVGEALPLVIERAKLVFNRENPAMAAKR